jgi:DNA topoisomerase-1
MPRAAAKRAASGANTNRKGKAAKTTAKKPSGPANGDLIIVESPTKIKTLTKFLGSSYSVMATKGHILDLPKSKLGVDLEDDFKPQYQVIKGKGQVIRDLVKAAKSRKRIFLAPDPDREGEAIAYHLLMKLDKVSGEIKRVTFNEITRNAVLRGLEDAAEIDMRKVYAQQARRILDRLVGYQVSPILWQTVLRGLSAGRVQSVALRIVCDREAEIGAFESKEYWSITGSFATDSDCCFTGKLHKIDGSDFEIGSEAEAAGHVREIENQEFSVSGIKAEEKRRQPYPPYITSTLQQDAARRIRFSPQKTMMVAQQLYEGIELGSEGSVGLITYMRTDSVRIAEEALVSARDYIAANFGSDYLPAEPRRYRTKKRSQDAHEAIRPTSLNYAPSDVKKYLTTDQFKLYSLVFSRFLASQMNPAVYDQIRADITGGKYLFRAVDTRLKFDGCLKVYQEVADENGTNGNGSTILPQLERGQKVDCESVTPNQHFTKPPPRYSEATLVKELESNGVGRPSTYAQIINTLKTRKYVEIESRKLIPTELGTTVNGILSDHFEEIFNVEFTAQMEDELDKIEEGSDEWVKVLNDFYRPFSANVDEVESKISDIKKVTQRESDELCDRCGSPMIIKWGRNGQFLACSAYPECKNTRPLESEGNGDPVERDCPKCGEPLIYRYGRFGKFIACSTYPDCNYTESITTGVKCPEDNCDGELAQRRSRGGKTFWGCVRYPECKFASWYKPVDKQCPACGYSIMVEKETKKLGKHLACPSCKNVVRLGEDEPVVEYQDAGQ